MMENKNLKLQSKIFRIEITRRCKNKFGVSPGKIFYIPAEIILILTENIYPSKTTAILIFALLCQRYSFQVHWLKNGVDRQ